MITRLASVQTVPLRTCLEQWRGRVIQITPEPQEDYTIRGLVADDGAYATPIGSTFEKCGNFNHDKGFEPRLENSQNSMYRFKTV